MLRLLKFKKVQFILKYQFKKIKNGLVELVLGSAWIGLAAALLASPPPRFHLNILIDWGGDPQDFPYRSQTGTAGVHAHADDCTSSQSRGCMSRLIIDD